MKNLPKDGIVITKNSLKKLNAMNAIVIECKGKLYSQ